MRPKSESAGFLTTGGGSESKLEGLITAETVLFTSCVSNPGQIYTVLKVGSSYYPAIFRAQSRLRGYKSSYAPLDMEKVEAIHLYQSTRKTAW